jgi:hypothetical protein
MILSEDSINTIIICSTLGIVNCILCVLCIKYDLFSKIGYYCSKKSTVRVTPIVEPSVMIVLQK